MLAQKTMDALAVMSGIKADVLAQAISDEQEQELELPEGRFLTKENESKLLDNHGKRKYDEGKSKGSKDALEAIKTDLELEGETISDVFGNYKSKVIKEAKVEPNQKLTEKENAIKALQESLRTKETEIESIKSEAQRTKRQANALSNMPQLRDDLGLNKSEALNIILSSVEQKEDGIYKDGKLLTDQYQEAIKLNDFLKSETESRGWVKTKIQGHGSKKPGSTGAMPKTYSEYQKYCESKGWNEGSLEAKQYLKEVQAKDSSFNFDE